MACARLALPAMTILVVLGLGGLAPVRSAEAAKKSAPASNVQSELDAAAKAIDAGKPDQAMHELNRLLSGSRLEGRTMARALYLRGSVYLKQRKPAQAIADLTSALWLKGGLTGADRNAASALRSQAYREAGLAEKDEGGPAKTVRSASAGSAAASPKPDWQTSSVSARKDASSHLGTATAPQSSAPEQTPGGGIAGFFSSLFGQNPTAPYASTSGQAAARRPERRQVAIGEPWHQTTEVKEAEHKARRAVKRRERGASKVAATAKARGHYSVQIATVRARSDAQAVVKRLMAARGTELGGREPEVDETVIGNMGTFYRVRIGPFAGAAESQALCGKLRGLGFDCLIMGD